MNGGPLKLKTGECAQLLGVSTDFIRDEIKDGRLPAVKNQRGQRTIYRVTVKDFKAYCEKHWPNVRIDPAA